MSDETSEKPTLVAEKMRPADDTKVFLALDIPAELARLLSADHPVHALSTEKLTQLDIAISNIFAVACPLISNQSDAAVVIEDLEALGYKGVLMVIAPPLPNPEMIATELRRQAHRINVIMINS